MTDYLTTDTDLVSIANAIRTKGGTQASLEYPDGFVDAIENIPSGGGSEKTVSITLAYGQSTSAFRSFTVYETTDGVKGQQIGSIASADGSTTVTVSASANGFVCELRGGYIMVRRDDIYSGIFEGTIGINVIRDSNGNVDIFYVCASDGRVELDWIDWDD